MRTAKTHVFGANGNLISVDTGTDAHIQRANFNLIGGAWPKDAAEVHFQSSDGPLKIKYKEKSEGRHDRVANAEKYLAEKAAKREKLQSEQESASEKAAKEKSAAEAKANAQIVEAKDAEKKRLFPRQFTEPVKEDAKKKK